MAGYVDPYDIHLHNLKHRSQQASQINSVCLSPSSGPSSSNPSDHSSQTRQATAPPKARDLLNLLKSNLISLFPPSKSQLRTEARLKAASLAQTYLDSNPLPYTLPKQKAIYIFCRHLLQNDPMHPAEISHFTAVLNYRLKLLTTATNYKTLRNLNFPSCHDYNHQDWCSGILASVPPSGTHPMKTMARYRNCKRLIREVQIFDPPTEDQGDIDNKPIYYLAAALASSGRSSKAVGKMIERLVDKKFGITGLDALKELTLDRCSCAASGHGEPTSRCLWCLGCQGDGDWVNISLE
ncbi:MAG: hypothetical protein Q9171_000254 [Xanthocarpia ochracea]